MIAEFGGPPISATNSAIAAKRAGADLHVATITDERASPELISRLKSEGIPVYEFSYANVPAGLAQKWGISADLSRWLSLHAGEYDVIHSGPAWQYPTYWIWKRRAEINAGLVLSPNEGLTDFDLKQSPRLATKLAKQYLKPRFLVGFEIVDVASHLELEETVGDRPNEAIQVSYHPVRDERMQGASKPRINLTGSALCLGYIGRLHLKKNIDQILEALSELPERVTLAIAGTGPEEENLRTLAEQLGVGERTTWLGFVAGQKNKSEFFQKIDVLMMPSAFECFGMAGAEAMCQGVPVIVSPRTGVAEVVAKHGGGMVVDPKPDSLVHAISQITKNPQVLSQMSEAALNAAAECFTFDAHGKQLLEAYSDAIARKAAQVSTG